MSDIAINDKGEALRFEGGAWIPTTIAENDKGERMAFDGAGWKSLAAPKDTTPTGILKDYINEVGGTAKRVADFAQTGVARVASNFAGAPSDLSQLGNAGAKWTLEKLFGPSPRTQMSPPEGGGVEDYTPNGLPPQTAAIPGGAAIKRAMLDTTAKAGMNERNLGDVKSLTLTNPFGQEGKVNLGSMLDSGLDFAGGMLGGGGMRAAVPAFVGGITSDALGQAGKGTKYETPLRIAGGILGAAPTMGAQSILRRTEGVTAPFTEAGKNRLAQSVVGGVATDPNAAVSILNRYKGDAVPGVEQTGAKIAADPGLLSMENLAYGAAGGNQRLQGMVTQNNTARATHLDSLESGNIDNFVSRLKDVDASLGRVVQEKLDNLPRSATPTQAGQVIQDALETHKGELTKARSAATAPLYQEVADWSAPVDAMAARKVASEMVGDSKGELKGNAEYAQKMLYGADGKPDTTAKGLSATRQALAHELSKEVTPQQERIFKSVQSATDQALESQVPAAKTARNEYERLSRPLDPYSKDKGAPIFSILNERRPMDPAVVPQSILRTGQQGVAGVNALRATNAPGVIEPMTNYVAGMVRGRPGDAANIVKNYPGIAGLDPALPMNIGKVAEAQGMRDAFAGMPAGRIAAGNSPTKELSTVLASPEGKTQINNMILANGGSENGMRGLRQGIIDDFKTAIESRGGTDAAEQATLMSAQAKNWITRKMEAAAPALTPEQRQGIQAIVDSLDVQSRTAPKMAGSDTIRNAMSDTFMGQVLNNGISKVPGLQMLIKPDATKADVIKIVADTLADPEALKAMLMKYNAANAKIADPIFMRFAKQQAMTTPQEVGGRQ